MEEEIIVTGYCRVLDQSRMVTAEYYRGVWEADCAWPDCLHAPQCQVAQKLADFIKEHT